MVHNGIKKSQGWARLPTAALVLYGIKEIRFPLLLIVAIGIVGIFKEDFIY
jgi:hypothetical protein